MENASKALIIAGAILLSILIISLGIIIYNQAADVTKNTGMSEIQTSTFNQKFTQYQGEKVSGSKVNSLIQAVIANNANEENEGRKIKVTGVTSIPTTGNNTITNSTVTSNKTYKVTCTINEKTGLVEEINITQSGSTTNTSN